MSLWILSSTKNCSCIQILVFCHWSWISKDWAFGKKWLLDWHRAILKYSPFFWLKISVSVSGTLWYLSGVFGSLEHSFRFCMQTWIIVTLRNLDTIYTWKGQNFLNLSKINTFIKIDNKFCKRLATEASNFDPDDMYKGLSICQFFTFLCG